MLTLVDISHNQSRVMDFGAARAWGIAGVYHKATEGLSFEDDQYLTRSVQAHTAGLHFGAYHFADVSSSVDAEAEAAHFCQFARSTASDLRPMLDLERSLISPFITDDWALAWCAYVEAHWTRPVIYTGNGWASTHLQPNPALLRYSLWVAHYTSAPTPDPLPRPWTSWVMWQWATVGIPGAPLPPNIPGIGQVDTNRCPNIAPLLIADAPIPPQRIPEPQPEEDLTMLVSVIDPPGHSKGAEYFVTAGFASYVNDPQDAAPELAKIAGQDPTKIPVVHYAALQAMAPNGIKN